MFEQNDFIREWNSHVLRINILTRFYFQLMDEKLYARRTRNSRRTMQFFPRFSSSRCVARHFSPGPDRISWRRSKRCRLFTSTNKNRVPMHDGETGKNIIRLRADGRINPDSSSNDELRNPRVVKGTQSFSETAFFDARRASRIILTHRGISRGRSFR